ncbi:MAG: 4Fe-4S binding protein [Spirochaetia bacterium]|jgi:polyferredoxin|nr:4Fe-4S binding protein [Spirochaetia bacterium]
MKRQQLRKLCLIVSLLLFPITLYYFSPVLILFAGLQGIINGSFIVFILMLVLSIPFGRVFCAYICPAGGLQACLCNVNQKKPAQGWRNRIKYVIWSVWIVAVVLCYLNRTRSLSIDFFFMTEHGISVSAIYGYVIYYGIILLIAVPSLVFGKRAFCHYLCWMAPFMVLGTKLRNLLHLPGLHVAVRSQSCIGCEKCTRSCPMGLDVAQMVKDGKFADSECIQCGACVDVCPRDVLCYTMKGKKEGN